MKRGKSTEKVQQKLFIRQSSRLVSMIMLHRWIIYDATKLWDCVWQSEIGGLLVNHKKEGKFMFQIMEGKSSLKFKDRIVRLKIV